MNQKKNCCKIFAIMLFLLYAAVPAMAEPAAVEKPAAGAVMQGTVNINTADAAELTLLPGIGPKTAVSIVDYRSSIGSFASIDELEKVKGIGSKTLEKLRPYMSLKGETTLKKVKQG